MVKATEIEKPSTEATINVQGVEYENQRDHKLNLCKEYNTGLRLRIAFWSLQERKTSVNRSIDQRINEIMNE